MLWSAYLFCEQGDMQDYEELHDYDVIREEVVYETDFIGTNSFLNNKNPWDIFRDVENNDVQEMLILAF